MDDGRADVLRRLAADEPFYWGLDVVFSDGSREAQAVSAWRALDQGSRAASVISGYYRELFERRPDADFLQQMSRGTVEPAARTAARASTSSPWRIRSKRGAFLDHELVSCALSLPSTRRSRAAKQEGSEGGAGRRPARGGRPSAQAGLPRTASAWLAGPLSKWAEERLFSGRARELDFSTSATSSTSGAGTAPGSRPSFDLWCLINLFSWYEHWFA